MAEKIVQTAGREGFVTREPSKTDRRSDVLKLTESGNDRFTKIEKDMYIEYKKVFSMIKKSDQDKVLEALRIYNEACRKAEDRANKDE